LRLPIRVRLVAAFAVTLAAALVLIGLVTYEQFRSQRDGAISAELRTRADAAAASIGLINAVGNLGGFVGPMVIGYLANRTHSFSPGLLYLVASLFVSGVLMLAVGRQSPVESIAL